MSSDTFSIRVKKIDQDKVEFICTTSTAGGLNDCAITRSFGLMIIEDGMPYSSGPKGTPLQLEMRKVAGVDVPPVWEADFHKKNVGKFIKSVKLIERRGIIGDMQAWQHGRFELEDYDNYPLHQFEFHVQVTDPKWLIGLEEGSAYGTTAFDAWYDDPKKQSRKELADIERKATRWVPPSAKKEDAAAPEKAAVPKKRALKKATPVKKAAPAKKAAVKKSK